MCRLCKDPNFVPRKIFSSADGDHHDQLEYVREHYPETYKKWRES